MGKKQKADEGSIPRSPPSFKKFKSAFINPKTCDLCLQFNPNEETTCNNCGNPLQDSSSPKEKVFKVMKKAQVDAIKSDSALDLQRDSKAASSQTSIKTESGRITSLTLSKSVILESSTFAWGGKVTMTSTKNSQSTFHFSHLLHQPGCTLKEGIFASYCLDVQWISQFLPSAVPFMFLTSRPRDGSVAGHMKEIQVNPFVKLIFPPMPSLYGCMHIKFLVLVYEEHVRVVIPSANLVPYDWDTMENIVYFQDFPLIDIPKAGAVDSFKKDLSQLLKDMGVSGQTVEELQKFDFTSALGTMIISKPGNNINPTGSGYGKVALSKAVSSLSLRVKSGQTPSIYCQSSSLGSLTQKWVNEFKSCICGKSKEEKVDAKFHLCFPSLSTVKESSNGIHGGGTIFFQRKFWNQNAFPKHIIYDCKSLSKGALMHSKIILYSLYTYPPSCHISFIHPSSNLSKDGYLYLGSHNHTRAAWGALAKNNNLNISNWELGVIIPFWFVTEQVKGLCDFTIPFQIPPPAYKNDDVPWIMTEHL